MFDYKNASKDQLKNQFKTIAHEMGDDQFFTKKELYYLPEVLMNNEQVLGFTSGMMDNNTWLITLTDRRIIFLDKGMLYGLRQSSTNLDKINAISGETGMLFGTILITDGSTTSTIKQVLKKTVKNFTNKAQDAIEAHRVQSHQQPPQKEQAADPYEKLEKLAGLRDKGIISEEEFNAEKKKILS